MNSAARSFTDWPGFMNSALPRISQPVASEARFNRISGVLPIASITERCMGIPSTIAETTLETAARAFKAGNWLVVRFEAPGRMLESKYYQQPLDSSGGFNLTVANPRFVGWDANVKLAPLVQPHFGHECGLAGKPASAARNCLSNLSRHG
jgi:hypothetical protein